RCNFLSEALPKATIIHSDSSDHDMLLEEGIEKTDAFVSLTALDEENIFLSLFANKMNTNCKKITKVNRLEIDEIISDLPIGSILSPKNITTDYILQYVRSQHNSYGSNVEALYRLMDNQVEALEFLVKEDCAVTDIPFINLNLKKNLLICCIVRKGRIITPSGRDFIQKGDKVIVVTTHKGLQDISDIMDDPLK
ncbi:MAG: NAD-binding protein, partial [Lachnospiraceae bacterium]|nr:NAD-binding protein [Lachnospiraceae bacterium]